jgi:hypothetical protein
MEAQAMRYLLPALATMRRMHNGVAITAACDIEPRIGDLAVRLLIAHGRQIAYRSLLASYRHQAIIRSSDGDATPIHKTS